MGREPIHLLFPRDREPEALAPLTAIVLPILAEFYYYVYVYVNEERQGCAGHGVRL